MPIPLKENVTPATESKTSWRGHSSFILPEGDSLKIESDGVEHLVSDVPAGDSYRYTINVFVEKL